MEISHKVRGQKTRKEKIGAQSFYTMFSSIALATEEGGEHQYDHDHTV